MKVTVDTDATMRAALGAESEPTFDIAPLDWVHRGAKRRRRFRSSVAVAVLLVSIAGLGSLVSGLRDELTDATYVSGEIDGAADSDIEFVPESRFVELSTVPDEQLMPDTRNVVGDIDGGFVGALAGGLIVRSDDGESWTATHRWDRDGVVVDEIRRNGSTWMAALRYSGVADADAPWSAALMGADLEVAFSDDLHTWTHVQVPLNLSERAAAAGIDLEDLQLTAGVAAAGRVGDRVLVQVYWSVLPSFERSQHACGDGRDERGFLLVKCDGTVEVLLEAADAAALGLLEQQFYTGTIDGGLTRTGSASDIGLGFQVLVTDTAFVAVDDAGRISSSPDGVSWRVLAELDGLTEMLDTDTDTDSEIDVIEWVPMSSSPDSVAFVGRTSAPRGRDYLAVVDVDRATVQVAPNPLANNFGLTLGSLDYNDEGWTMLVNMRKASGLGVVDDRWRLSEWSYGPVHIDETYVLQSLPWSASGPQYDFTAEAGLVRLGLFGEIKARVPGQDDLAIDLVAPADRFSPQSLQVSTRRAGYTRGISLEFRADGWTIEGDPLAGPLIVTSPDGQERQYRDGFLFFNGTGDDGVELRLFDGHDWELGILEIYEEGDRVWSIPFVDVLDALAPETFGNIAAPGDAWIITSTDGQDWTTAWHQPDAGLGEWPTLVVDGDGRALVKRIEFDAEAPFELVEIEPRTGDGSSASRIPPDRDLARIEQTGPVSVRGERLDAFVPNRADPMIGVPAPTFEASYFDGIQAEFRFDEGTPTVVLFLAHWSEHSQRTVEELATHWQANGLPAEVQVLAVSPAVESGQNYPPSQWLLDAEWPTPVLRDGNGTTLRSAFGAPGFPFVVAIDSNGLVTARQVGAISAADFDALIDAARATG